MESSLDMGSLTKAMSTTMLCNWKASFSCLPPHPCLWGPSEGHVEHLCGVQPHHEAALMVGCTLKATCPASASMAAAAPPTTPPHPQSCPSAPPPPQHPTAALPAPSAVRAQASPPLGGQQPRLQLLQPERAPALP
nr:uclacyanin-3-like [Aegilops tauschii subsp. strangulata]